MLLTILLVVSTMNAVNFVDGLDGLAGGVVLIGAVAFFLFSYQLADANGETLAITAAMLCAAMGGACAGFLPHNFFPARIFMGDSGSMLLGLVLSGSALTLTGQFADGLGGAGRRSTASWFVMLLPILLPISILIVPLADLVLAVVRRTRRGQAFYQPDKEHLHHRLLEIGHSQRRAVLIMWLWAGLIAFGGGADQPLLRPADLGRCSPWSRWSTRGADLHPAAGAAPGRGPRRGPSRPLTGPDFDRGRLCATFHKTAARRRSDEAANDDDPHLEQDQLGAPESGSVADSWPRSAVVVSRGRRRVLRLSTTSAVQLRSAVRQPPSGASKEVDLPHGR